MADDGMLLNFATNDQPWQAVPTFKGGRWKDRLTAKKAAENWRNRSSQQQPQPTQQKTPPSTDEAEFSDPRPAKRQRTEFGTRPERGSRADRGSRPDAGNFRPQARQTDGPQGGNERAAPAHPGNREVISSLFSFNPRAKTEREEVEEQETEHIQPSNAPLSSELETFTSLGLSRTIANHLLTKMEIKQPTSIQSKAVSQLLKDNSDAFIQAETGSGKTLAYLLPIVQRLVQISETLKEQGNEGINRDSGLFAVILAPTRELSKQISTVLESLLRCAHWIVAGTVIGGEKKKSEKARLRKGVNILVATPGRLADHLNNTEVLNVSNVRWLVLDEGDRLMELGFEQDIQRIIAQMNLQSRAGRLGKLAILPEKRMTILCSATLKMSVQKLGEMSLKDAAHIAAEKSKEQQQESGEDGTSYAPAQLKQSYAIVPAKQRLVTLVALLKRAFARRGSVMKTIVFLSCADTVDFHFDLFTRPEDGKAVPQSTEKEMEAAKSGTRPDGRIRQGNTISETRTSGTATAFSTSANPVTLFRLHGSLPQAIRTSTLQAFTKTTDPAVLICTDVASRGLDLPNVDYVIEYDPPFSKDDHLHRIGRTARAGRDGRALIFLMPGCEESYVTVLQSGRRDVKGLVRHDADELLQKGFAATTGVVDANAWEERATDYQLDAEQWALQHPRHLEQARRAYQSHIRAYATHVASERHCFDIKSLHLGHLAKAFALRDRPGSIKVPGLRPGKAEAEGSKAARKASAGARARDGAKSSAMEDITPAQAEAGVARKKMRDMMRKMGGASEFNLG